MTYPLGVSDCFAVSASRRRDGIDFADSGVVDDPLGAAPIDARLRVRTGQRVVVEDAVGLVRLVERVVDERVGDFAQTAPSGPSRFARIVGHVHSGRLLLVPTFTPQSINDRRRRRRVICNVTDIDRLIETIGATPPRRPNEQSEL